MLIIIPYLGWSVWILQNNVTSLGTDGVMSINILNVYDHNNVVKDSSRNEEKMFTTMMMTSTMISKIKMTEMMLLVFGDSERNKVHDTISTGMESSDSVVMFIG